MDEHAGGDFDSLFNSLAGDDLIVSDNRLLDISFPSFDPSEHGCRTEEPHFRNTQNLDLEDFMKTLDLETFQSIQTDSISEADTSSLQTYGCTSKPVIDPMQQSPFVCGFQRCSFEAAEWNSIVSHRRKKHPHRDTSKSRYRCERCSQPFSHANNLIRHRGTCGNRRSFYCPDCLTRAPLQRRDNYNRHRKTVHHDNSDSIKPFSFAPPVGYRSPIVPKNPFVLVDFTS